MCVFLLGQPFLGSFTVKGNPKENHLFGGGLLKETQPRNERHCEEKCGSPKSGIPKCQALPQTAPTTAPFQWNPLLGGPLLYVGVAKTWDLLLVAVG